MKGDEFMDNPLYNWGISKMFEDITDKPDEPGKQEDQLSTNEVQSDEWDTGAKEDVWRTGGDPNAVWDADADGGQPRPNPKDPNDPVEVPGPMSAPEDKNTDEADAEAESYGIMDDPLDDIEIEEIGESQSDGGLFEDII